MKTINEMNLTELTELLNQVNDEIKKKGSDQVKQVIFDASKKFVRYNGGWTKKVTGIDKTKLNGFSILGDFINGLQYYEVGGLYLDCGIGGSRKNQKNEYVLFTLNESGDINVILKVEKWSWSSKNNDWAIQMWGHIEAYQTK